MQTGTSGRKGHIMKPDIKTVIFDMDGTIIDSEPISKAGWRHGIEHQGLEMPDELFASLLGLGLDTAKQLLINYYGPDFDFGNVVKERRKYIKTRIEQQGLPMKKGLIYLLDKLDSLGIKKCIATSAVQADMEYKLNILNLRSRFDGFVTGDQITNGKPHPDIFLKAAKLMETDPANCIVLEDSLAGIAAAYNAGIKVIMIPDMIQPDEEALGRIFMKCPDLEKAALIFD